VRLILSAIAAHLGSQLANSTYE